MGNVAKGAPREHENDELDDSWFDLPVVVRPVDVATVDVAREPAPVERARPRTPEDELDDSWFDRPGRGIRRSDVLGA